MSQHNKNMNQQRINMKSTLIIFMVSICLLSCNNKPIVQTESDITEVNSRSEELLKKAKVEKLEYVLSIGHSSLAKEAGSDMAASRVDLFSDDKLNSKLMDQNILVGLDLPFRVISYAENNQINTLYTDAIFLQKRHNLPTSATLDNYQTKLSKLTAGIANAKPVNSNGLIHNYGIKKIISEYDFDTTIQNLKRDILKEGDTVWFTNWDYKEKAKKFDIRLSRSTLLIFGAPAPGAKAMAEFPSIGLDAFGQKVLVFMEGDAVIVAYNDITDFAELHYQDSAFSHTVINYRLGKTLSNAVTK